MNVQKDYEELFALLNREKVKYLIVGAHAVGFYGQPRYTGDIDIFFDSSLVNGKRILCALERFGFGKLGITVDDLIAPGAIMQLGYPPVRIDFINMIDGVSFENAWRNCSKGRYGKQPVNFISRKDLIKNKKASGRQRDLFDLELLGYKKRNRKQ